MNNQVLQTLSVAKPFNYEQFINFVRSNKRLTKEHLDYSKITPLYCSILIIEVLNGSLERTKLSNKNIIYRAFSEDPKIVQIKEVREFIKNNFTKYEQILFLSN